MTNETSGIHRSGFPAMLFPFITLILFLLPMNAQPATGHAAENLEEAIRHYGRAEFRRTIDLLRQLAVAEPENAEIRYWLGKTYLRINNWDDAVREMEKAVQLEPARAYYRLWLGRAAGARADNTIFFRAIGWARRVVSEFEKARDLEPENVAVRFDLLEFYSQAPGIVGGGRAKAEAEARKIAELDPSKGYIARATLHERNNDWDGVKKELTRATIDFPQHAFTHKDLAGFLLRRNDYRGALEHGRKAMELDPGSKRTQLIVAAAHIRLTTDLEQAVTILQLLAAGELYDGDPSFEEVYYWLGEGYLAKGEKEKAREAFNSALVFNPDYSRARDALSKIR
jgi:tetratricopeptide (TPR) repeat protein